MKQFLQRLLVILYTVIFLGLVALAGVYFNQAWREYQSLRATEQRVRERLHTAEARLREQEIILQRLRTDPAYVELVIRRRLGYVHPEEFVVRFDD